MQAIVYTKEDFKQALKSGADEIYISGPYADEVAKKFSTKEGGKKPEAQKRIMWGLPISAAVGIAAAAPAVAAVSVPALLVAGPVGAAVAGAVMMKGKSESEAPKGYVVVSYAENSLYLKKKQ